MRIAVDALFLSDAPTGVGVFTREVAERLCAVNADTIIFSSADSLDACGSNIRHVPSMLQGSRNTVRNGGRFLYENIILPRRLRAVQDGVLFCPITEFPFRSPIPTVVTVHDLHPVYYPLQFGLSARVFRYALARLKKCAARVVVPSVFTKNELDRREFFPAGRIDVAPLGYDAARFQPPAGDDTPEKPVPPYILFVGSLFPYKNAETLIEAFLKVKGDMPHRLVIAGRRDVARGPLPADARIDYLDYVPHEKLPDLYRGADVVVQPSRHEGFGLTALEAMACGAPVIASTGGALPEVVGSAGLLFDPDDPGTLAEHLLAVGRDPALRDGLRKKGLERAKAFSWDRTAERVFASCRRAFEEAAG